MSAIESRGRIDPHRLKFLVELGGGLRRLSDPIDISAAACEAIRGRLGAAGAAYATRAEFDSDALLDGQAQSLRAGETLHCDAVAGGDGWILAPIIDEDGLAAVLSVHSPPPRVWSEADIALVEVVAERTWDAILRARATTALRESEDRFRAMADCAPAPVWVTSSDGRLAFVNQAFRDFAGLSRNEKLGSAWLRGLHPDDAAAIVAKRQTSREGYLPFQFEARFQRHDGEWRWMLAHSHPRFDATGEFQGYVGLAIDQTETRAAVAALRESEARFRLIAESAPVMLWMAEASGRQPYLNRTLRTFLGDPDMEGFDWTASIHPEDLVEMRDTFAKGMADHSGVTIDARFRRADGEWRCLRVQAEPRFDGEGAFLGMIGVDTDITDTMRAQEDLTRINVLLAERIASGLAGNG